MDSSAYNWGYSEAFSRNIGLITREEQEKLKTTRVAIAGMGGVGGIHLITLARLGVGRFTICDFDTFELANFNRQYGATVPNLRALKAEAMKKAALEINPNLDIRVVRSAIQSSNIDEFLDGANVFIDGIDAFVLEPRRALFQVARQKKIFSISAGPFGFSTAWVVFDPDKMCSEHYFGFEDTMDSTELFAAFVCGIAPKATHRSYVDLSYVDVENQRAPSVGFACQLAAGVTSAEVLKIVLKRGTIWPAPWYQQFDPYLGKWIRGKLRMGGKGPFQRFKRRMLAQYLRELKSKGSLVKAKGT